MDRRLVSIQAQGEYYLIFVPRVHNLSLYRELLFVLASVQFVVSFRTCTVRRCAGSGGVMS